MRGPFTAPLFNEWWRTNPLLTRPKKDSLDLRVILDLSFPEGSSVNSHILREELDGAAFKLRLPSPLDLARLIAKIGPNCRLYKIDLSRAYRQLRGDPLDWPLTGVLWDGQHYIDMAIPFGLRHGASACQRVSEAEEHCAETRAYIDDTAGAAVETEAESHYNGLLSTHETLGLEVAPEKCQPPSVRMTWVGVTYDCLTMTMHIEQSKIDEAIEISLKCPQLHCTRCKNIWVNFSTQRNAQPPPGLLCRDCWIYSEQPPQKGNLLYLIQLNGMLIGSWVF